MQKEMTQLQKSWKKFEKFEKKYISEKIWQNNHPKKASKVNDFNVGDPLYFEMFLFTVKLSLKTV